MTPVREDARDENATLAVVLAALGIVPLLGLLTASAALLLAASSGTRVAQPGDRRLAAVAIAVAAATIALQALLILPFLYSMLRGAATGSLLGM
jgi:hypothetical protein